MHVHAVGEFAFRRSSRRRGVVAPFTVIMLTVLLSCAALTVDLGYVYVSHAQMQNAVDASALAGASGLLEGSAEVGTRAVYYAGRNVVLGSPVTNQEIALEIGNWEGVTGTFFAATGLEVVTPNAVRVVGTRSQIPLLFARVMGITTTDVAKQSTATLGSGQCLGIWGLEGITGNGDIITDSYDSAQGAYGGTNVHPNGDICSCQDISLAGSVEIFGDVMFGAGYDLSISGGAYDVWGVVSSNECALVPPTIDMFGAIADNDNITIGLTDDGRNPFLGNSLHLRLTGQDNLTLAGGTYYFTSISIRGSATLTIAGPTEIYVSGDVRFGGNGIINLNQNPTDLKIYSTGSTLTLGGTANFYGAVIAPETDIRLTGTGDFFGTLIGKTVDIIGSAVVHIDESVVGEILGLESVSPSLVQ